VERDVDIDLPLFPADTAARDAAPPPAPAATPADAWQATRRPLVAPGLALLAVLALGAGAWQAMSGREAPGATGDPINGFEYLSEAYQRSYPGYDDRYSVPVLWDRATGQIVNNESSEIIVMLNGAFNEWAEHPEVELYPAHLRPEIDAINEWVYSGLNNGVYRAGFASSQEAYDEAVGPVFETLDRMDALLARRRYLAGSQHTLADWRAFPTLMRFDLVYHGLFRCTRRRLIDYENLWPYLRDLYQTPRVAPTVDFDHFIRGYNLNLPQLNPAGIIPIGPELDFNAPHGRENLGD